MEALAAVGTAAGLAGNAITIIIQLHDLINDLVRADEDVKECLDELKGTTTLLADIRAICDDGGHPVAPGSIESRRHLEEAVVRCTEVCERFRERLESWTGNRGGGKKLLWRARVRVGVLGKGEIRRFREQIAACRDEVHLALSSCGLSETRGLGSRIDTKLQLIDSRGTSNTIAGPRSPLEVCRDVLSPSYVDPSLSTKPRVAGTCEWIKGDATYQTLLRGESQQLWIHGGPGKGKSTLASFISEQLASVAQQKGSSTAFLSIICSGASSSATPILQSLLWQLVEHRPALAEVLVGSQRPNFHTAVRSEEFLWMLLLKALGNLDGAKTYCLLDGLDECEDDSRRWLAKKLVDLQLDKFQCIILSRDVPHMNKAHTQIDLDSDVLSPIISQDVRRLVSAKVQELSAVVAFTPEFQEAIESQLVARSEGTFLHRNRTGAEDLPTGLSAIYQRMLSQIAGLKLHEECFEILHLLTATFRPLLLRELTALVDRKPTENLDSEQVLRDRLTLCGPLIEIRERTVKLVHQSAKEYLQSQNDGSSKVRNEPMMDLEALHLQIARTCLDCLNAGLIINCGVDSRACKATRDSTDWSDARQRAFLYYAVNHWIDHARFSPEVAQKLFAHPSAFYKQKSLVRVLWHELYARSHRGDPGPIDMPVLHLACYLGIVGWVTVLMKREKRKLRLARSLRQRDQRGFTPLGEAVRGGHEQVVRLLLDAGADVDGKDSRGMTPAILACDRGHAAMVKLMIDRGANVMMQDPTGQIPLHHAALQGNIKLVAMLLDAVQGADADARDEYFWTPLHNAVMNRDEECVRLLLAAGANAAARTKSGETALSIAASVGDETLAKMLLIEHKIDPNSRDRSGCTPLFDSASVAMSQLLLEHGAVLGARNDYGATALRSALNHRDEPLLRFLISQGADLRELDSMGQTLLHGAAFVPGDAEMGLVLLGLGLDPTVKDMYGRTALDEAIRWSNQQFADILLKHEESTGVA
ncbi:ankyrin repeat-containing domain protein [Neohortaea acidophila]|uniref:Ankyrin repeat-containing domain protein n=1 Tax=Neohortaea acidophila TaxID=245834 RepID=A0A6A6PX01_9PEZI|nr:ankyrin repeat-containing domain protein [Neohortaea acidophila]KAF2484013.1 ankyrin repeat-containing domain protein [Neohortaea acidophila]